jgi:hypothetical protein
MDGFGLIPVPHKLSYPKPTLEVSHYAPMRMEKPHRG